MKRRTVIASNYQKLSNNSLIPGMIIIIILSAPDSVTVTSHLMFPIIIACGGSFKAHT